MLSLLFTQLIFHTEVKRDGGAKDYSPWEQATEWKNLPETGFPISSAYK